AVVAELLVEHHLLVDGGAEPAVLLRPGRRDPTTPAQLGVELLGRLEGAVIRAGVHPRGKVLFARQVLPEKGAHVSAQPLFLVAAFEFHVAPLSRPRTRGRCLSMVARPGVVRTYLLHPRDLHVEHVQVEPLTRAAGAAATTRAASSPARPRMPAGPPPTHH